MVKTISATISRRGLMKVFLCAVVFATTGVVNGVTSKDLNHETEAAVQLATASLQREIDSLQEQLELFELKHETLQAASEHFRVQSKSAKSKLDEERSRYEILASEKRSLETTIKSKVARALEEQKANFEDTIAAEHIDQQELLEKEIQELGEKLRLSEYKLSRLENTAKQKLKDESKQYAALVEKQKSSEGKLRTEIADLKERLSFREKQAKSFEESWKNAVAESETKDNSIQEESEKRMKEASLWEGRIRKAKSESEKLFKEKQAKEGELIESEKLRKALLKKVKSSDEAMKQYEAKFRGWTTENKRLSNDLKSKATQLAQSKKNYASLFDNYEVLRVLHQETELMLTKIREEQEENVAKRSALETELIDAKFELEVSQNNTKQLMVKSSETTKAYTKAIEELSSKNDVLQNEVVDMKFDLEKSQNETQALIKLVNRVTTEKESIRTKLLSAELKVEKNVEKITALETELVDAMFKLEMSQNETKQLMDKSSETTKTYTMAIEELSSKNNALRNEVVAIKFDLEKSQNETQSLIKRIKRATAEKESIQTKLLSAEVQVERNEETKEKFEGQVRDLTEQLDSKSAKNLYLQRSLLDTKDAFEKLQIKVKHLEGQNTEEQMNFLETEKKEITQRVKDLEQELEKSSSLYDGVNREIHSLKEQLKTNASRSAELSRMYETMKEENDILTRNLRAAEKQLNDAKSSPAFEDAPAVEVDSITVEAPVILGKEASAEEDKKEKASEIESESLPQDNVTQTEEDESQTSSAEESASPDISSEYSTRTESKSDPFFQRFIRVIVDSCRSLMSGLWKIASSFGIARFVTPFKPLLSIVLWALNELRIIHYALVSLFEFEMTFVSSLLSREKDRTGFAFLIRHSQIFVMFGEAIAALLGIDFIVSSFIMPRRIRKRRPKAKAIEVPKTATTSLLRKANNM